MARFKRRNTSVRVLVDFIFLFEDEFVDLLDGELLAIFDSQLDFAIRSLSYDFDDFIAVDYLALVLGVAVILNLVCLKHNGSAAENIKPNYTLNFEYFAGLAAEARSAAQLQRLLSGASSLNCASLYISVFCYGV